MKPPRGPVIDEVGAYSAPLYEVLGNAYGLPDAPRVWGKRVVARATGRGFSNMRLINASFITPIVKENSWR